MDAGALEPQSDSESDVETDQEPEGHAGLAAFLRARQASRMARMMLATEWAHPMVPEAIQHFAFALRRARRWPLLRVVLLLQAGRGSVHGRDTTLGRALHLLRDNPNLQQVLFQFL